MIDVPSVDLPLDAGLPGNDHLIVEAAARTLGIDVKEITDVRVLKRSVDARKKSRVRFVAKLGVSLRDATLERRLLDNPPNKVQVSIHAPYMPLSIPLCPAPQVRPVVVGTGPAGLFCALYLARAGLRPLVLERGSMVDMRTDVIERFMATGTLDPECNIQFGEGGAGTFSDGKLTTNVKNPLTKHVLRWFADAGAPEEILWQSHPHLGSDLLPDIVANLRKSAIDAGATFAFDTKMVDMTFESGKLQSLTFEPRDGEPQTVACEKLIVACGHSARDVFELCSARGLLMERKPFSVGVRIEHPQELINRSQWGASATHPALDAADYKLAVHLKSGRSVYTFCMCPGGEVVAAASEQGGVVTNGMSSFARDDENANSAVLVNVEPDDFPEDDVLAGVRFQRELESAAYNLAQAKGGAPFAAPAQTVQSFLSGREPSFSLTPTYRRSVVEADLRDCLPEFVSDALAEALPLFDRRLKGFADGGALMTAVETRSSSPVRIKRDATLQASIESADGVPSGFFPCGEGAGFAGGIMSAAVDGLRVARAVAESYECD